MHRFVIVLLGVCMALPASAHLLKIFATVKEESVAGYAFFLRGGRLSEAEVVIKNAAGEIVHRGETDAKGRFSWQPPTPADYVIVVNARDGHIAKTTLQRSRFPAVDPTPQASAAPAAAEAQTGACSPEQIRKIVAQAVARQIRPLLEAHAHAVARNRITSIVGGIGMIIGLAGIAMWGFSRRRERRDDN